MSKHKKKRALTLIEVLIIFVSLFVLLFILLPSTSGPRPMSKRLICGANMKGIGTSLIIDAQDRSLDNWFQPDDFMHNYCFDVKPGDGNGTPTHPDRTMPTPITSNGVHISTTRIFWNLIRSGDCAPKQFICPSSGDVADPTLQINLYFDFTSSQHVSFGYNVALFRQDTKTIEKHSSYTPVAADRSPYDSKKVTLPPSNMNTSMLPSQWKPYNSSNHGSSGQNILYADGHSFFEKKPIVGVDEDNIFTTAASCTNSNPLLTGVSMWTARDLPYDWYDPKHNPYAATDALIFP